MSYGSNRGKLPFTNPTNYSPHLYPYQRISNTYTTNPLTLVATKVVTTRRSASVAWGAPSLTKLADVELLQKREKGLHYGCDEKYSSGTWCKNSEL